MPTPSRPPGKPVDLITRFARHRVACNLLMAMMILAGLWGLTRLNTQFFPTFALEFVNVHVKWTGAAAEDVETAITLPLEQQLRTMDGLREMRSTSSQGRTSVTLEYQEGTDMGIALDQVKEQVALLRNLPPSAEAPEVSRIIRYEPVARMLVTGTVDLSALRSVVRQMERELLDRGIAKIRIIGLPEEEIAVQVPSAALHELDMSLDDIAARIARVSMDIPAGNIGRNDVSRQLRALDQQRSAIGFERLALLSDRSPRLVTLEDIAKIERRARSHQVRVRYRGRPAIALQLRRAESADSLDSAEILQRWVEDSRHRWPPGIEVHAYDESWQLIRGRIALLVKNGAGGLVLVVAILFFFLNGRVATWVALGIPVSFMATLGVLYLVGGSINMVSLFALIMALGIIVDDAIVVGEDALTHYQAGDSPLEAATGGAWRMLSPVLSSSLTTIAAFLPLMLVSGIIGNILFDIPLVVVCVIAASLVESFLVLPGHLRHSFTGLESRADGRLRARIDAGFVRFRENVFRPMAAWSVRNPSMTICTAVALFALAVGLVAGKRIAFNFFPTAEGKILYANVSFVAGTPPERVEAFMARLESSLLATEAHFGGNLVGLSAVHLGEIESPDGRRRERGDQLGQLVVELTEPDARDVRNPQFISAWRERVRLAPGVESFSVVERRGGPPGRDVDVRLIGADALQLKAASLALQETLKTVPGVIGIEDDMPYGQEQLIYRLTQEGRTLGLTVDEVGSQLRAAYDGRLAQIFQDGDDEIEVRVMLPDRERHRLSSLANLNVALPGGGAVPLLTVVEITTQRGFDALRHKDGELSIRISADVDPAANNNNDVIADLASGALPAIASRYGVDYTFEGRQADQRQTLGDMGWGALLALVMIYLVLAWVFSSYGWPLVVMTAIPFGMIGAIGGHWLLQIDLTLLSLFGLFGLSGIVVNDSIILVVFFKELRAAGVPTHQAIVDAACSRLRAVLLTSLTTIGGLTPLMFETSRQAQFLIPMAVSISFGLAFATALVLLVIPALLITHENFVDRFRSNRGEGGGGLHRVHPLRRPLS